MEFIDLGYWKEYTPNFPPDTPELNTKIIYYRNESTGQDWYQTVAHSSEKPIGFVVMINPDGISEYIGNNVDELAPKNHRVVVFPEFEDDMDVRHSVLGKTFNFETGEFESVVVESPVPQKVTRAQALLALYSAGMLDPVEEMIANHPYPPVRIWFANALYWDRNNVYIQALGPELGLTEEEIDQLFIAAAQLS